MRFPPMLYHFKIHKERKEFWAECLEFPDCIARGRTKEELYVCMKQTLEDYFIESGRIGRYVPPPAVFLKTTRSVVKVGVNPSIVKKEQGRIVCVTSAPEWNYMGAIASLTQ